MWRWWYRLGSYPQPKGIFLTRSDSELKYLIRAAAVVGHSEVTDGSQEFAEKLQRKSRLGEVEQGVRYDVRGMWWAIAYIFWR